MRVSRMPASPSLDLRRTRAGWLEAVPADIPRRLLPPAELQRQIESIDRYVRRGDADALADVEARSYRLAGAMLPEVGRQTALRCLRDGLAQALIRAVRESPALAEPVEHVVWKVTDAVWQAHVDALQARIEQQERDRLHEELMVAKRIQQALLPREVPEVPGFDIAGRVLPAAEVGGDYWSCKSYPEDDIVTLKLADVTGHGIAAATLVAAVKFISGGYYRGSKTAAQVMARTNHVLVRETPHEILVTMVYAWLYPESHELTVVNAGHAPVLLFSGGRFRSVAPTGPALGMIESRYTEIRLTLEPGDVFFTCSDGLTEPSAQGALGEQWVREQVAASAALPAAELVRRVLDAALHHYGEPRDDMSVVALKRTA